VEADKYLYKFIAQRAEKEDIIENIRFEVFATVTMKNAVFWDINPSSYLTENTLRLRYRAKPANAM
jgi:hypothetical protein